MTTARDRCIRAAAEVMIGPRTERYATATAAFDAIMRELWEPSPEMIDRFVSRALCVSVHGDGGWSKYAREQWQAMLGALSSDPHP